MEQANKILFRVYHLLQNSLFVIAGITLLLISPAWLLSVQAQIRSPDIPTNSVCTVDQNGGADYISIQAAINDLACSDIQVSSGTYIEWLTINRSLNLTGSGSSGANATVIMPTPAHTLSVIGISGPPGIIATLSDLSVQGGNTIFAGGGIFNSGTNLTLENVLVLDNEAARFGGGIYTEGGQLTLKNSIVTGNYAGEDGGGLWISGEAVIDKTIVNFNDAGSFLAEFPIFGGGIWVHRDGDLILKNSRVELNEAMGSFEHGFFGGGIFIDGSGNGGELTMVNTTVSQNEPEGIAARNGGSASNSFAEADIRDSTIADNRDDGLAVFGIVVVSDSWILRNDKNGITFDNLTLIRTDVRENTLTGVSGLSFSQATITNSTIQENGQGIYTDNAEDLVIRDSSVIGNNSFGVRSSGDVTIEGTTISGNSRSGNGGGIILTGGLLQMVNSTISGNSSDENGGGIYISYGSAKLTAVTITENTADADGNGIGNGGGIFLSSGFIITGTASLTNTILAQNYDLSPLIENKHPDCSLFDGFLDGSYSLMGIEAGCTGELTGPTNQVGTTAAPLDPAMDILSDNGGPALTHALLPGSPAIDWSWEDLCGGVDQRGAPRPDGGNFGCDIGAYEIATCSPAVTPPGFTISRSNRDAVLNWADAPSNREYIIFRGQEPYNPATAEEFATLPSGVATDKDYGVLIDVDGNYFYAVIGENACGEQSAPTQILGEFTSELNPDGSPGPHFELITLPLTGVGLPEDADSLAAYIDPGGSVKRVARWNPGTGSFIVRVVDCPVCGFIFAVNPGDSIAIAYSGNGPAAFSWVGAPPPAGSFTNPLQPNTANLIQVPLDQAEQFPLDAAGLIANIGGLNHVAYWNRSTKSWQIFSAGGSGTNFEVKLGYPYVAVSGPTPPPSWP